MKGNDDLYNSEQIQVRPQKVNEEPVGVGSAQPTAIQSYEMLYSPKEDKNNDSIDVSNMNEVSLSVLK